jgi:hypothetical protein
MRFLFIILWLTVYLPTFAQQAYFQQEVHYDINVRLDDAKHTLNGDFSVEYTNNSPDTLREIWMHLWGNAYKKRNTAFAKQKLRDKDTRFYFSEDKDLGYFSDLDFSIDGQKTNWRFDKANPDIALLTLAQPLPPGGRIRIATPLKLQIPASFSRLGHVETSYQVTQWYPKPAVYDHKGWHPMPYLDQGEFYSEFGSFDVRITLPANYVVGATGVLQNPEERVFLEQKEAETREKLTGGIDGSKDPFPPSDTLYKTLHYTAEQVHDFAWFADKRFMVLRDTARMASGRKIECWAMFTTREAHLWQKGAFYVKRSVEFYSTAVGEYPWPQATAVHSALSAGGGMEYPMITVIGNSDNDLSLDEVITHEVGHNWFYGILASNEREHPFLDEGFNTYYERRYMQQYYGKDLITDVVPKRLYDPEAYGPLLHTGHALLAREHLDLPPDSPSAAFSQMQYGLMVYMKTGLCMEWLEKSVGVDVLDPAMQAYYSSWKFKHPYPEDVKKAWADAGLQADWFFDAMQTGKQADYALSGKQPDGKIIVRQKGDLAAPFPIVAYTDGEVQQVQWVEGFAKGQKEIAVPENYEEWAIDPEFATLDVQRLNNQKSGFQVRMIAPFQHATKKTLGIMPGIGFNHYDKLQIGAAFYNPPVPTNRFQYYVAPAIGLGSGELVGMADLRYRLFPGGVFPKVTLGVSGKTYNQDYNWTHDYYSRFWRVVPEVRAELRTSHQGMRQYLNARVLHIGVENGTFEQDGSFSGTEFINRDIYELRYELENRSSPNPFHAEAVLEFQDYNDPFGRKQHYVRGGMEWRQRFYYNRRSKIYFRTYAGVFLQNTRRKAGTVSNDLARASFALNPQGFNDYRYDQVFLARTDVDGILSRQISDTEGGFKNAFGSPYAGLTGNSNDFIVAINLKADLPKKLPLGIPLKPYFDLGYYHDASPLGESLEFGDQVLWSGGLMLDFGGVFEVFFPLVNSGSLKDRYCEYSGGKPDSGKIFCGGNYWQWISWRLNIQGLRPERFLESNLR